MKKLKTYELKRLSVEDYKITQKLPLIVVLDNVRSMHNVGSIFRTCDAFLVSELILCGITACPPNSEINKTAIGATDSVKWSYSGKTIEKIKYLKDDGFAIIGVEQTDKSIMLDNFSVDVNSKYVLVFGNEVNGIGDDVIELLDYSLEIPQYGTKHSLNITVAAGIVLYKFVKESGYIKNS